MHHETGKKKLSQAPRLSRPTHNDLGFDDKGNPKLHPGLTWHDYQSRPKKDKWYKRKPEISEKPSKKKKMKEMVIGPVVYDETGAWRPIAEKSGWYRQSQEKSFLERLQELRSSIAAYAQVIYDGWDQSDEELGDPEFGHGGICDVISSQIMDIVSNTLGVEVVEGGQDGDNHSWVIAYDDNEAFGIDIPHGVYELGAGYGWKKIPGVKFLAEDVEIFPLNREDIVSEEDSEEITSDSKIWYKFAQAQGILQEDGSILIPDFDSISENQWQAISDAMVELGYQYRGAQDVKELSESMANRTGRLWQEDLVEVLKQNITIETEESYEVPENQQRELETQRLIMNAVNPEPTTEDKDVSGFGITYDYREAGYILPDGRMLDFSGGLGGQRGADHSEINRVYPDDIVAKDKKYDFRDRGNIRISVTDYYGGIDIGPVPPTDKQLRTIQGIVKHVARNQGEIVVDTPSGSEEFGYRYPGGRSYGYIIPYIQGAHKLDEELNPVASLRGWYRKAQNLQQATEHDYVMNVQEDSFIHFTPADTLDSIEKSKALGPNGETVFAVSTTYGEYVPVVQFTWPMRKTEQAEEVKQRMFSDLRDLKEEYKQTNSPKTYDEIQILEEAISEVSEHDDELRENMVAIHFKTSKKPAVGYSEEVKWEGPVPLDSYEIISPDAAISTIKGSPEFIDSDAGQVQYANKNIWYRKAQARMQIPEQYQQTINELNRSAQRAGMKVYAVGGFVRDLILGRTAKDLDVMVDVVDSEQYAKELQPIYDAMVQDPKAFVQSQLTGAKEVKDVREFEVDQSDHRPEFFRIKAKIDYTDKSSKKPKEIEDQVFEATLNPSMIFSQKYTEDNPDRYSIPRGEAFGIHALMTPIGEVEVAYPRTESYEEGSRKPRTEMGLLSEDASRRDFGMNSLFLDLEDNEIIDKTGHGLQDIQDRVIRISDPESIDIIFRDDPLRILRAIRQAAQLGFQVDPQITEYVKANPHLMAMKGDEITWDDEDFEPKLSSERIAEETRKIMSLPGAHNSIQQMNDLGIIHHVFKLPDNAESWTLDQINPHHYQNVWDHTISVMKETDQFLEESGIEMSPERRFKLNMAGLLHDTGKLIPELGYQNRYEDDNLTRRTFVGHPEQSEIIGQDMMRRLKFSNNEIEEISNLVRLHDVGLQMMDHPNPDYLSSTLIGDIGDQIYDLMFLTVGDRRAHAEGSNDSTYFENFLKELPERYDELKEKNQPFFGGREIMSVLGEKAGPIIGKIQNYFIEQRKQGIVNDEETARRILGKLPVIASITGFSIDQWFDCMSPHLLMIPEGEEEVVTWVSKNSSCFLDKENKPLIQKNINGKDVMEMAVNLGFSLPPGPIIGQIITEAFEAQLRGELHDDWLRERVEQERPQEETQNMENIEPQASTTRVKIALSETNQKYAAPMSTREDRIDNVIDIIIAEHEALIKKRSNKINWERIDVILNDNDFLNSLKSFSQKNPVDLYETYCGIRDENIQKYVAEILDENIKEASSYQVNFEEVADSVEPDVLKLAYKLIEDFNHEPDIFRNVDKVEVEDGDFFGVFEKSETNVIKVNTDRIKEEAKRIYENIRPTILEKWGLSEEFADSMKNLDEKHIQALLLAETIVHESGHSAGLYEEDKATKLERTFLKNAIEGLNRVRKSEDTHGLPLDLK